jgi:hypothetical protein
MGRPATGFSLFCSLGTHHVTQEIQSTLSFVLHFHPETIFFFTSCITKIPGKVLICLIASWPFLKHIPAAENMGFQLAGLGHMTTFRARNKQAGVRRLWMNITIILTKTT